MRWCDHLETDKVIVCLCPQVIEEIARLKDMGEKKAIRKRAAALCKKIAQATDEPPHILRAGETLSVYANRPDFSKWIGLNEKSQDDHIIAFALHLQEQVESRVAVASADISLGLRIRLKENKLKNIILPDNMRLEIADEEEKRIRQLEEELNQIKKSQPQLVASFVNAQTLMKAPACDFLRLNALAQHEGERAEQEARAKHPLRRTRPPSFLESVTRAAREPTTEQEVADFNAQLESYYQKVRAHRQHNIFLFSRLVAIEIQISNQGTTPASSVHAYFHFPDGFSLCEESGLSDFLAPTPKPPLTASESIARLSGHSIDPQYINNPLSFNSVPEMKGDLTIRKSNSYDVTVEYEKIRQGESKILKKLYAVFETSPESFQITYRIIADNTARPVEGQLSVVVESS